jgi:uncharacterized protein with HEPN domain
MPRHDDSVSLRQMLDHAREAVALFQNRSRSDLDTDRVLSLALVRLAEIIGEAATRVSMPRRKQHTEIPWSQIISLRNRLIHGYDTIDFDILWQILTVDLPELIAKLEKIVPPENM